MLVDVIWFLLSFLDILQFGPKILHGEQICTKVKRQPFRLQKNSLKECMMKMSFWNWIFDENSINSIKNEFLGIILLNYSDSYNMELFLWCTVVHDLKFQAQIVKCLKMRAKNRIGVGKYQYFFCILRPFWYFE